MQRDYCVPLARVAILNATYAANDTIAPLSDVEEHD
jgi:hypothetical protein